MIRAGPPGLTRRHVLQRDFDHGLGVERLRGHALARLLAERATVFLLGPDPLEFARPDPVMLGHLVAPDGSFPVNFIPVRSTVHADAADEEFQRQVYDVVLDCVNQTGVMTPSVITPP